jgi:hypothetical protein
MRTSIVKSAAAAILLIAACIGPAALATVPVSPDEAAPDLTQSDADA